jgi:dihydrofolate synthase / folylpolyglutamate synthase
MVDFLYHKLPFFQKDGASALRPKLDNTLLLCEFLGNPQNKLQHIHIAGTNGKGSTSHILASILAKHGFKVGLYTSPHLKSFTERIKTNGVEIPEADVIEFVALIKPKIEEICPSFFEVTVAMAFWYFERQKTDICVVEVGMGGRLDSTNIIQPIVSVITNISLDHQQYLGDTLEKIAFEKGGIIKNQTPVVIGEIQSETLEVFATLAKQKEAPIYLDYYKKERFNKCKTNSYQDKNIITCLKTIEVLEAQGFEFDEEILSQAIKNFKSIANLKGRWQILSNNPKMVCDTGHNIAGIREVIKLLEQETFKQLHFVFGMVSEKEVSEVLSILPKNANYYFCQADNPRAMSAEELSNKASIFLLKGKTFSSVVDAIEDAQLNACENDLIFIGGSNFVVAEIPFL